jgi:hypothetical protein
MFGFRPQYWAQAHETFKPFFNSLYRRYPAGVEETPAAGFCLMIT